MLFRLEHPASAIYMAAMQVSIGRVLAVVQSAFTHVPKQDGARVAA